MKLSNSVKKIKDRKAERRRTKAIWENGTPDRIEIVKAARNNILKGTAVVAIAVSILTGLAFSNPADITADQTQINQPPVVMELDDYANTTIEDDDDDATEQKKGFSAVLTRFKQAVLSLPRTVRIVIIVPAWLLGTAITTTLSVLWNFLFSTPIGGFIVSTLVGFAVLLGLFVLTSKMLFPELPVKQILSKRNISILAVSSILLAAADAILPFFWSKYPMAAGLFKLCTGALIISLLIARTKAVYHRAQYLIQNI